MHFPNSVPLPLQEKFPLIAKCSIGHNSCFSTHIHFYIKQERLPLHVLESSQNVVLKKLFCSFLTLLLCWIIQNECSTVALLKHQRHRAGDKVSLAFHYFTSWSLMILSFSSSLAFMMQLKSCAISCLKYAFKKCFGGT